MFKPRLNMIPKEVSHFLVAFPDIHLTMILAKVLECPKKCIGELSLIFGTDTVL